MSGTTLPTPVRVQRQLPSFLRSRYRFQFFASQLILSMLLLVVALTMLTPFLFVLSSSLTEVSRYDSRIMRLWPGTFSLRAYRLVLTGRGFVNALKASLFITGLGTPLNIFVTACFAYGLSKPRVPGRSIILTIVLITMLFGGGLIPFFLLIRRLGLLDTWWALILPSLTGPWGILVLKSFFQNLPVELEESARIDGSSDLGVFFRIVLPLSKAPLAAMTLFSAVGFWNVYFSAVIFISQPEKWPLQVFLANMSLQLTSSDLAHFSKEQIEQIPGEQLKMATTILVALPILMVYPFLQKYFAHGVLLGAVKG